MDGRGSIAPDAPPTRHVWRRLSGYALRRWPAMTAVVAVMLVKVAVELLRPWPMKFLVDHVLKPQPMPESVRRWVARATGADPAHAPAGDLVFWCVLATVVLFLLVWAFGAVTAMSAVGFGKRLAYDLAADLFGHLQRLSLRYHSRRSTGDAIRRVLVDSGCMTTLVKDAAIPAVTSVVMLGVMFWILWGLSPVLTAVSLAVVPMMALAFRLYARRMTETSYEQHRVDARVYETVERTLASMPVVQAFCREDDCDDALRSATRASVSAALTATDVQLKFKVLIGLATAVGTSGMLWLGAHQVLGGRLTVGELLVFLAYLASIYGPLEALAYTSSTVQTAAGGARRVVEVFDIVPEVTDGPSPAPAARLSGEVTIEDVTVGYEPGRPVLRGVTLRIGPGETVAVVGPTGAGKSTLAGLVPRFADAWSGRVALDGVDVRDLPVRAVRRQVAVVLQEPFLFPVSVAENIAYGRPGATRAEVEAAARAANAHEFVSRLPGGYDAVVGERGATLSGGERQRLSIARALLKDAPVLVLDEPTSALDARTERSLLEALDRLMAGRTTIVIAHRLSTVRNADRIVVMDGGRIAEVGTHDQLATAGGLYARLCARQFAATSPSATGGTT